MGIFSKPDLSTLDPAWSATVADGGKEKSGTFIRSLLVKAAATINATLEPGETILVSAGSLDGLLLITDRRSILLRKTKIDKQFRHGEIAETRIFTTETKVFVAIESTSARLDFNPNDPMRFTKIIQVEVSTPRVANQVCAAVDQYLA